jgi:hypothetical protein
VLPIISNHLKLLKKKCKFNENCKFKLCQFKEENETSENLEVVNKDVLKGVVENDILKDELTNKFNKLTVMEKPIT